MARRYHLRPLPPPGKIVLPAAVGHHLARVLRLRVGAAVVLFDGEGTECAGTILAISGNGAALRVEAELGTATRSPREPAVQVEAIFAPPRGNRAEWVFEHGTEVGIAVFRPVRSERSHLAAGSGREARWRRIAAAATGQCDRARIPQVDGVVDLAACLQAADLPAERYVADPDGPPLGAARSAAAVLLVGPEGGLTSGELDLAARAGFERASLGVTTLRAETAVIAGAILLLQGPCRPGLRDPGLRDPELRESHGDSRPRN